MSTSVDDAPPTREPAPGPLAGFTVGVTAARRAHELTNLLHRRGAEVIQAPALRIAPLADDHDLWEVSRLLTRRPADIVVATTGTGFRGWLETCQTWGLDEALLAGFARSRLLPRGPKATGAIRAAGLNEEWSPPSESSAELLDYLLQDRVAGLRVAVQLHGTPLPEFCGALREAGAEVLEVPVYQWRPPEDPAPLDRLIGATLAGEVDAVTFTSAPAVQGLLDRARTTDQEQSLLQALRGPVLAMSVGSVTAAPLLSHDVPTTWPQRARTGAMVKLLGEELASSTTHLSVAGHDLGIRGQAVVVDGELRPVSPALMRLLTALARHPGRVRDRAELRAALGGEGEDHAVETAIARLRTVLGDPRMVRTVVKRGYRLAVDTHPHAPGEEAP